MNQFHRTLREHLHLIQITLPHVSPDLQPPQFLHEQLAQMKTLMSSFDTSFAVSHDSREEEFNRIIEEALEPYLTYCITIADHSSISAAEKDMYLINCFDAAKVRL